MSSEAKTCFKKLFRIKSKQGFLQSRFQHLSSSSSDWAAAWSCCSARPKRRHKVLTGFCLETSWWVGLMDADGRSWWSRFTPRSVPVLTSEQDNINKSWKLEWVSGEGGGCGEEKSGYLSSDICPQEHDPGKNQCLGAWAQKVQENSHYENLKHPDL